MVSPLHYPQGYTVRVAGGRVVDRERRQVLVRATGERKVAVRISRR